MADFLLSFVNGNWLIGSLGVVVLAVVAMLKGRIDGAAKERERQWKDQLKSIKAAKEIEDEVGSLDDVELGKRYDRWMRREGK